MTDVTQGADAPNDSALFEQATSTDTLEKFVNPELPPEPATPATPAAPAAPTVPASGQQSDARPPDEPVSVPAGRLREESEARRRAERERDELRGMLYAQQPRQQQPQQQQQPQRIDIFDNPDGFVDHRFEQRMQPLLDQLRADFQNQREAMSLDWAVRQHGDETVQQARQTLEQGMSRGDPVAWNTYNRAMQSHDPYGLIVRAHREGETLRTIGGDLDGYNKRYREQLLADPEFRKEMMDYARGQASATGNSIARPIVSTASQAVRPQSSPSLGDVGAGGRDERMREPSDDELFRAAVSAKRR